jgi:hypothetical protein
VVAAGYDAEKKILGVQFASGTVWHYGSVPYDVAAGLFDAPSKGRFYAQHIKQHYPGARMTGPCPSCGSEGYITETCDDCGTAEYVPAAPHKKGDAQ